MKILFDINLIKRLNKKYLFYKLNLTNCKKYCTKIN